MFLFLLYRQFFVDVNMRACK